MTPLFHDRFGKFSSEEGEVILNLLLLRREIAQSQLKLLIKRSEHRAEGFLLFREVAKKSPSVARILQKKERREA